LHGPYIMNQYFWGTGLMCIFSLISWRVGHLFGKLLFSLSSLKPWMSVFYCSQNYDYSLIWCHNVIMYFLLLTFLTENKHCDVDKLVILYLKQRVFNCYSSVTKKTAVLLLPVTSPEHCYFRFTVPLFPVLLVPKRWPCEQTVTSVEKTYDAVACDE